MLNDYVWKLYLNAGGSETVAFFEKNLRGNITLEYIDKIGQFQEYYCASKGTVDETKKELLLLHGKVNEYPIEDTGLEDGETIEDAFVDFNKIYSDNPKTDKEIFGDFIYYIEYNTTLLALLYPGIYIPYYFGNCYIVLTLIADAFDISLPKMPKKSDYSGRLWYYVELCKTFHQFRMDNNLSPYELCAFLYDFAPHYIGGKESYLITDLPAPKSAFFIGGGGDNGDQLAEDDPDMVARWQCSPQTHAGDMIVMYLRAPISAISSIWRSQSVGFIDPFFYYYRCTIIGRPVKIPRMSIKSIKADSVLGKMPIVGSNMQGINGVELKPSEYNYIVDLSGVDVLKLEYAPPESGAKYASEKEVEEKLIKPLIKKLGYSEDDYVQQMYIEIGNHNHALIPDFVLLPERSRGHYSGFTIIEGKRSIKDDKELETVKAQARSYAFLTGKGAPVRNLPFGQVRPCGARRGTARIRRCGYEPMPF